MPLSRKVSSEEYMVKDLIRSKLRFITIINERGLKSISKNMQSPRQRSFPHFARLREAIQTSFLHFARRTRSRKEAFLAFCTSCKVPCRVIGKYFPPFPNTRQGTCRLSENRTNRFQYSKLPPPKNSLNNDVLGKSSCGIYLK